MIAIQVQWAIYGLVVGALAAFLVLYCFQPRTIYPPWIVFLFDQPWIIFLFGLFGLYLLAVNDWILGSIIILISVSIMIDRINFGTYVRNKDLLGRGAPANALREPTTSADQIRDDVWYEAVAHDEHVGAGPQDPKGWEEMATGQAMFHGLEEPQPGDPAPVVVPS